MADEQEPEVIRQQMEAQRAALTAKLETLENKIVETVEGAREAVAETVETVKEGVRDSVETVKDTVHSGVETVKETFDVRLQVERHPWAMFGGAVVAGFAAGYLINRAMPPDHRSFMAGEPPVSPPMPRPAPRAEPDTAPPLRDTASPHRQEETWTDEVKHLFAPELNKLKEMAIGAALGIFREMFTEPLPEPMRPQFTELVDSITRKLGGEPVRPQTLHQLFPHHGHPNGNEHATAENRS